MSRVNGSDVKRVLCLTTSRADFGLLRWPMRALADAGDFDLKLVASGGHLAASQGETVSEIIESGFEIAARIPVYAETGAASDAAVGLGQSAQAVAGVIARLRESFPDLPEHPDPKTVFIKLRELRNKW